MNVTELARKFALIRAEHEKQDKILKALSAEWDEVEAELLDAMVEEGVNSIKVDGKRFSMVSTNFLSVTQAAKPQFFEYMKEVGQGAMIKEDVNTQSLKAFLKNHLIELTQKYVEEKNLEEFDARKLALETLAARGAGYFTKRTISGGK